MNTWAGGQRVAECVGGAGPPADRAPSRARSAGGSSACGRHARAATRVRGPRCRSAGLAGSPRLTHRPSQERALDRGGVDDEQPPGDRLQQRAESLGKPRRAREVRGPDAVHADRGLGESPRPDGRGLPPPPASRTRPSSIGIAPKEMISCSRGSSPVSSRSTAHQLPSRHGVRLRGSRAAAYAAASSSRATRRGGSGVRNLIARRHRAPPPRPSGSRPRRGTPPSGGSGSASSARPGRRSRRAPRRRGAGRPGGRAAGW